MVVDGVRKENVHGMIWVDGLTQAPVDGVVCKDMGIAASKGLPPPCNSACTVLATRWAALQVAYCDKLRAMLWCLHFMSSF